MGVSDLAIEAAMKAEAEDQTYHIIDIVQSNMEQKGFALERKFQIHVWKQNTDFLECMLHGTK